MIFEIEIKLQAKMKKSNPKKAKFISKMRDIWICSLKHLKA